MKSPLLVILILAGICFSFIQPARSEVIHGVAGITMAYDDMYSGINWNEAFDFSTQTIATLDTGDLSWGWEFPRFDGHLVKSINS
jgi:hypothetical protein